MSKPDDIPQDVWGKAASTVANAHDHQLECTELFARVIMAERERNVVALADLDAALCQFLNNAADEYNPAVWVPSIKRDFAALSAAYNHCHRIGTMDLRASVAAIRNRGAALSP